MRFTSAAIALATLVPSFALASSWEIDPSHTQSQFTVRHMMITDVRGEFGKTSGKVELDDKDPTKSTVEITIDAASIDTREPKRDEHLKSAEFFDVANHPNLTFKSKKIQKAGKNKFKVVGDLTLRGVTKEVPVEVTLSEGTVKDNYGLTRRGFSATSKVSRKEFGLKWNPATEAGGVVVGDEVKIAVDGELIQKAAAGTTTGQK